MRNHRKGSKLERNDQKAGELRHFGSMAIRKAVKGDMVSAQERLICYSGSFVGMMTWPWHWIWGQQDDHQPADRKPGEKRG